ncbi:MAG: molybdopterin-dependent oxidoreductase, partial [Firmicutes bacterium]|nr:molybdopterin-dependent oxidoreductase [Bacillota bacterium]
AMDSARTAIRLGAEEVYVVYRRAREQMPAQDIEVKEAEEEGVKFHLLASPVQIEGNGKVEKIKCQKMALGEPDASGRRRPEPIPGEFVTLEVDTVIAAIGQEMEVKGIQDNVAISKYKTIQADDQTFTTNIPGVFAGGDCAAGPGIAIEAIAAGKRAAEVINGFLNNGKVEHFKVNYCLVKDDVTEKDFADEEKAPKAKMPVIPPEVRVTNFKEIEQGLDGETLTKDAQRCLQCGCLDSFECKLRKYATRYNVKPERIIGEKHKLDVIEHPFILRDPSKCILCGLCVRTCSEIIGVDALGLVNRGFDAIVSPSLDLPLEETSCVACGQCVAVCPTGALYENMPVDKAAAWEMKKTLSTCGYCGVGCSIQVETMGDKVCRVLPADGPVNEGILCKNGRFGFDYNNSKERLEKPLIKEEGSFKEVTWDDALLTVAKKAKSLKARFGGDSIAVFTSPAYTNEELYLIQKFARATLGTNNINSLGKHSASLLPITGFDASTSNYDEIAVADFLLVVGADFNDYPIAALKIKKSAQKGSQLFVINNEESKLEPYCTKYYQTPVNAKADFLAAFAASALEKGLVNEESAKNNIGNFEGFKSLLQSKKVEEWLNGSNIAAENVSEIVDAYAKAKSPL